MNLQNCGNHFLEFVQAWLYRELSPETLLGTNRFQLQES